MKRWRKSKKAKNCKKKKWSAPSWWWLQHPHCTHTSLLLVNLQSKVNKWKIKNVCRPSCYVKNFFPNWLWELWKLCSIIKMQRNKIIGHWKLRRWERFCKLKIENKIILAEKTTSRFGSYWYWVQTIQGWKHFPLLGFYRVTMTTTTGGVLCH